jgi:hypothetical protein
MQRFKKGDRVRYQGKVWSIEKDYGNGVYFLGRKDAFCDMVPDHLLKLAKRFPARNRKDIADV